MRGPKAWTSQLHVSLNAPRIAYFRFWPGMPPTPSLSPQIAKRWAIRGERRQILAKLTQGGARGSCPSLALGYFLPPLPGLNKEEAASCRFKNVQFLVRQRAAALAASYGPVSKPRS